MGRVMDLEASLDHADLGHRHSPAHCIAEKKAPPPRSNDL